MEKRTQTGLVMGHAYGVTAVKKVLVYTIVLRGTVCTCTSILIKTDT